MILSIAEFHSIQAYWTSASGQIAQIPLVTTQAISLSNTQSLTSAAFNANTNIVRLCANTACCVTWGDLGTTIATATATSVQLPPNTAEYFGIRAGQLGTTQILAALATTG